MQSFLAAITVAFSLAGVHHHQPERAIRARHEHRVERRLKRLAAAARRTYQADHPPFSTAFVSYYNDAGTHCCGYYATYGVAVCGVSGVCVPQGTQIEFCDRRCVMATADDHGPYVYGRAFDLNENTAAAIGFDGLGDVRYRIMEHR